MVVVIGKLSHVGVYGKVFTGKDWLVSKLHLLSFCADGTHVAVEPSVSSPYPVHGRPPRLVSLFCSMDSHAPVACCSKVEQCLGLAWGASALCWFLLDHTEC